MASIDIFKAYVENVRALKGARRQLNKSINQALRSNDAATTKTLTNLSALLYTAFIEAEFQKLIHTPYGFQDTEIQAIQASLKKDGLGQAWKSCADMGLRHVPKGVSENEIPNIRQYLMRLFEENIVEPAIIRNKIAHGQWAFVVNRDIMQVNAELTGRLSKLNPVEISLWFEIYSRISNLVERLIESPDKSFKGNYWGAKQELDSFIDKTKNYNAAAKVAKMKLKEAARKSTPPPLSG